MPKPQKQGKRPQDVNQWARQIVQESTHEDLLIAPATSAQISAYMAEIGAKGGKIGGKRRLRTMTAKERSAIAKRAARSRWKERSSSG